MHVNTVIKPLAKGSTARFMSRPILGISLMRVNIAIKGLATHLISNGTNLFTLAKSLLLVSSACDKRFIRPSQLRTHQQAHGADIVKPYICLYCDKGFTNLTNYRDHERMHTGLKPFLCKFCNKCFTHLSTCKKHELTHTGVLVLAAWFHLRM